MGSEKSALDSAEKRRRWAALTFENMWSSVSDENAVGDDARDSGEVGEVGETGDCDSLE